jgi:hypothetical protein
MSVQFVAHKNSLQFHEKNSRVLVKRLYIVDRNLVVLLRPVALPVHPVVNSQSNLINTYAIHLTVH